jgi:glyoxylase-like metal-dependent hydrolase (beta-lactamase superfamily II)
MTDRAPIAGFAPGVPALLAPGVRRVVAPNASPLTGPGTNSYLLGDPPVAILDPGPDVPGHLAALLALVPAPRYVFCTHTHRDHSPLARQIAARTGARLVGRPPPDDGRQDCGFAPDEEPDRDRSWSLEGAGTLRAIDTPGHASNHVCYLLEPDGLLFSGDHILDGVTPVILAPDGDMQAYLDSLLRLKRYRIARIAPGHGRVLAEPIAVIDGIVAHRAEREARVVAALEAAPGAALDELLAVVYAQTDRQLWPMARFSLAAILTKLQREGRAVSDGRGWSPRAGD